MLNTFLKLEPWPLFYSPAFILFSTNTACGVIIHQNCAWFYRQFKCCSSMFFSTPEKQQYFINKINKKKINFNGGWTAPDNKSQKNKKGTLLHYWTLTLYLDIRLIMYLPANEVKLSKAQFIKLNSFGTLKRTFCDVMFCFWLKH